MRTLFLIITFFFFTFTSFSQESASTKEVYQVVGVNPEPEGGMGGFYRYIVKNLRYPEDAKEQSIEGKVFVMFLIDENGKIPDESIVIHQGLYPSLDEEAIRLIKGSPDWTPGRTSENGPAVKVRMILPITFKLDTKTKKRKNKK